MKTLARLSFAALLSALPALLGLFACTAGGEADATCGGQTCATNQRCIAGTCRQTCQNDDDCSIDDVSRSGTCLGPSASSASGGNSGQSSSSSVGASSSSSPA